MKRQIKVVLLIRADETDINAWLEINKVEIISITPYSANSDTPNILIVYYEK